MKYHYDRESFSQALREVGLKNGSLVFSHSNVGFFGLPKEGRSKEAVFSTIFEAFRDVIGPEGILTVPTFTYSLCKGEDFNIESTPSSCGLFTEMLRTREGSRRSEEPIFSIAATGEGSSELLCNANRECFGYDSFWERLYKQDAILCNLNFDGGSTFVHYVERCLNVPYRYDKYFSGHIIKDGVRQEITMKYFCREAQNEDTDAYFVALHNLLKNRGLAKTARVGRGSVLAMRARDVFDFIGDHLRKEPFFLTQAYKENRKPELYSIQKNLKPSMPEPGQMLAPVGQDIDSIFQHLARFEKYEEVVFPTGSSVGNLIVPEGWSLADSSKGNIVPYSKPGLNNRAISLTLDQLSQELCNQRFLGETTPIEVGKEQSPDYKIKQYFYHVKAIKKHDQCEDYLFTSILDSKFAYLGCESQLQTQYNLIIIPMPQLLPFFLFTDHKNLIPFEWKEHSQFWSMLKIDLSDYHIEWFGEK